MIFKARKSHGTATRAVGVISLYMPAKRATLCVLYSVPYDTNLYSNWWNVNFYLGTKKADENIYKALYYDLNPFKPNGYHSRRFSSVMQLQRKRLYEWFKHKLFRSDSRLLVKGFCNFLPRAHNEEMFRAMLIVYLIY